MPEVSTYTELTTLTGNELLYGVGDPTGTPTSNRVKVSTLLASSQPFAKVRLTPAPAFDLASGVLGVGALISHSATVTIPAGKQYDHMRVSKEDGGYNVFEIGNGGEVIGMNFLLRSAAASHANSNSYGIQGTVSNAGPGSTKGVYGRTNMETGCTGYGVAGVFSLRAVATKAGAWILQITGTDHVDMVAHIYSDDGPGDTVDFADGIVYNPNVRIESGGAFFKAFSTDGHDGQFLSYRTQSNEPLFVVDKRGVVTINPGANGADLVEGLLLVNTTSATAPAPAQWSPMLLFEAHHWNDESEITSQWEMGEVLKGTGVDRARFEWVWSEDEAPYVMKQYIDSSGGIFGAGYISSGQQFIINGTSAAFGVDRLQLDSSSGFVKNANTTGPLSFQTENDSVRAFVFDGKSNLTSGNLIEGMVPGSGFTGSLFKFGRSASGGVITTTLFDVNAGGYLSNPGFAFRSGAADPTTSDIAAGNCAVWKNTSSGAVKLWCNDGGVMKSGAALT